MNAQVLEIMNTLNGSDRPTDVVKTANNRLEAVATLLDALKAEYSAKLIGSVIEIDIEPKLSYNSTRIKIDINDRSIIAFQEESCW